MDRRPLLQVLAGTNGAGKSSVGGAAFRSAGADYYNPDEAAHKILAANPGLSQFEANALAWGEGKRLLERAIDERLNFAFETTLGGRTLARLILKAAKAGFEVRVWYVGLESAEMHIARVRSRVDHGGHDIPEQKVRERYHKSRENLIALMPHLSELRVYDNSAEGDPKTGKRPRPRLILHYVEGRLHQISPLELVPDWAKPLVMAALKVSGR